MSEQNLKRANTRQLLEMLDSLTALEAEEWQALMRQAQANVAPVPRKRKLSSRAKALVASASILMLLGVAVWTNAALAQGGCTVPAGWPAALQFFCPSAPAQASQVNQNALQLHNWIVSKTGPVNSSNITTSGLTVNGSAGVSGHATVGGNVTATGQLRGGSIRQRSCAWQAVGKDRFQDNQTHQVICPAGRYMNGWRCYASSHLDGDCAVHCCLP